MFLLANTKNNAALLKHSKLQTESYRNAIFSFQFNWKNSSRLSFEIDEFRES